MNFEQISEKVNIYWLLVTEAAINFTTVDAFFRWIVLDL
jgi:hypothetical protein